MRVRRIGTSALVALLVLSACSYEPQDVVPQIPANAQSSKIFAADGTLITTLHGDQNRVEVSLTDIPLIVQHAVIAIEDERFYEHPGIDIRGILRAARRDTEAGEVAEGGSTITQQLVKQTLLDSGKTVSRKLQEVSLAYELERRYTKDRILEIYLNTIYFGNGAYGVEAAAETYFAKHVGDLTAVEAATIAGLIQAPNVYDPLRQPEAAVARRNIVLDKMHDQGYLGDADHAAAIAAPLGLAATPTDQRYPAAHFVDEVKKQILNDPRFGATDAERQKTLFDGGLRIYTTLDLSMQAAAEQAIASVLPDADNDPEAAVVSIEPSTGFVRALVGGRDYFGDKPWAKIDLATGTPEKPGRPTGSSFKPIVLATALEEGIPLTEVLPAPGCISLPVPGTNQTWTPCNADPGEGAPGGTTLLEGTVHSFNTLYAQLILQVGPQRAIDMAKRLGITTPLQAVPAAVLGSNDVEPIEMASVYATFANRGVHVAPTIITRVTTADGTVLYEAPHTQTKAITAGIADTVSSVLTQVIERGTGTAAKLDRPAAGKTGTGQDYTDAWFCGYTPDLATAVWVGFPQDDQTMMTPPRTRITVYGGTWPAQIWQQTMSAALAARPPRTFVGPTTTTTSTVPVPTTAPAPRPPVTVPNVVGMTADAGTTVAQQAGLSVSRAPVVGSGQPPGTIVGQSPGGGASAPAGSTMTIEVEAGPDGAAAVPSVVGMDTGSATHTLQAAGFTATVRTDVPPNGEPPPSGTVWKQSPVAGTVAAKGSVVTLTASP